MPVLRYPTVLEILETHDQIILQTGGTSGIINMGSLEAAVERATHGPFHGAGSLEERAALLLRGICQDHPFADGNKRTAFAAAHSLLFRNGYDIEASQDEVVDFMLRVARVDTDIDGIEEWIGRHTRKL